MKKRLISLLSVLLTVLLLLPAAMAAPQGSVDPFQKFFIVAASLNFNTRDSLCALLEKVTKAADVTDEVVNQTAAYISEMTKEDIKDALTVYAGLSDTNRGYIATIIIRGLDEYPYVDKIPNISKIFNQALIGDEGDVRGIKFFGSLCKLMNTYTFGMIKIARNGNPQSNVEFYMDSQYSFIKDKFSSAVKLLPTLDSLLSKYQGDTPFDRLLNFAQQTVNSYPGETYYFKLGLSDLGVFEGTPYKASQGSGGNGGSSDVGSSGGVTVGLPFSDLQERHSWAFDAIMALTAAGVLNGTGEGLFNPDGLVTREQFTKMLVTALGFYNKDTKAEFADVSEDSWYYTYVASAFNSGIVQGIGDGVFGSGQSITRQQMAIMAYRAAIKAGLNMPAAGGTTFTDEDTIADYARDGVHAMAAAGIIKGMGDGTFAPNDNATRAQAAVIIYRLLQLKK